MELSPGNSKEEEALIEPYEKYNPFIQYWKYKFSYAILDIML